MSQVWLGGIYLKDEGGYEIVLRAMSHYLKRLKSIGKSPELKDAPMFAQIVISEASKIGPQIAPAISKIKNALGHPDTIQELQADIQLYEKALICYESDIRRAQNEKFYSDLLAGNDHASADYKNIKSSLEKIKQFS